MSVVILKYNSGNICSVQNALRRLDCEAAITDDEQLLLSADKDIFPGVGEASTSMQYLRQHRLDDLIYRLEKPFLGICIGLQLMCRHSEEGNTDGLGIFDVEVKRFPSLRPYKIPHMGWNTVNELRSPLFLGVANESYLYYVHSYRAELGAQTIATTDYIQPFSAALQKDNFYAVQFHPEKSADVGQTILKHFLDL
jgi:glutamine amidotransferase